jgi:hypothetical protein
VYVAAQVEMNNVVQTGEAMLDRLNRILVAEFNPTDDPDITVSVTEIGQTGTQ